VDVRVLGGRARHLAGAMCRLAVQSVLARPSDSLLFAPPVSGFRAVNVQLNW